MSGELISDHYNNVDSAHTSCSCSYVIFVTPNPILSLCCEIVIVKVLSHGITLNYLNKYDI